MMRHWICNVTDILGKNVQRFPNQRETGEQSTSGKLFSTRLYECNYTDLLAHYRCVRATVLQVSHYNELSV